jgi:hypothetical protein
MRLDILTFLGYNFNPHRTVGRSVGRENGYKLETWGFEKYSHGREVYTEKVNNVFVGEWINGTFVDNPERTLEARREIIRIAPKIFVEGRERLYQRIEGIERLEYEPIERIIRKQIRARHYLADPESAWKFRRLWLGNSSYDLKALNDEIKRGKIMWFAKPANAQHHKYRTKECKKDSVTSIGANVKLFRLIDLIQ